MTPPDLAMSRFQAQLECMQGQPDDTEARTGRKVALPALGNLETDEGQDEVGDLVAEQEVGETILVFEMGLAQAKGPLEISEHSLNPEARLIPGDCLLSVVEGGTQIPYTTPEATDDDVNGGWFLVVVWDIGEEGGGAFIRAGALLVEQLLGLLRLAKLLDSGFVPGREPW